MPKPDVAWNRAEPSEDGRWRRFTASLPMRTALLAVATVWLLGAVWSFTEQSAFAGNKGFSYPHLLPLVIDGFAVAMAGVAWAASLDARPAVAARLATVIAVAASSASNGAWAYLRTDHDLTAVVLGVTVPIAANLAFEVLLAEMRRQVQRRRGLPPPVAIPYPRLIRLGLAPFRTFVEWRALVLDLTSMDLAVSRPPEVDAAPTQISVPTTPAVPTVSPAPPAAPVPSVTGAAGTASVQRAERRESLHRESVRSGPTVREPVGIERVRRELAQYSEITRQEPAWGEPASHEPFTHEPTTHEPFTNEPTAHEPTAHEPVRPEAAYQPARHEPPERDPAREPVGRESGAGHESVGQEAPVAKSTGHRSNGHVPARQDEVREAATPARAEAFVPAAKPSAEPTRRPTPAAAAQNGHPPARRRDLEAVPAVAPARLSAAQPPARTNTSRRAVDPRVEMLAAHLASTEDAGEFTGEMVGPLLNIDVAPRTGRRLLGQARDLMNERSRSDADPRDDELSAAIGSG